MKNIKIGCIIQARSGSSRLPNKIHMPFPLNGEISNLEWVVRRVEKSQRINEVIIATTTLTADDGVEKLATKLAIPIYRGSVENVLSRFFGAAQANKLDVIVRVTGDCPGIDPQVIDELIAKHIREGNDYTSNTLNRSYPHGLDAEVFNFSVLEEAYFNVTEDFEKEHVTPYVYKTHADKFKIGQMILNENHSSIRFTLDTYEDYLAIAAFYDLYPDGQFNCATIIETYLNKPWLFFINKHIEQKKQYLSIEEEYEETLEWTKKQDLFRMIKFLEGAKNEIINFY